MPRRPIKSNPPPPPPPPAAPPSPIQSIKNQSHLATIWWGWTTSNDARPKCRKSGSPVQQIAGKRNCSAEKCRKAEVQRPKVPEKRNSSAKKKSESEVKCVPIPKRCAQKLSSLVLNLSPHFAINHLPKKKPFPRTHNE
ncbi:hypothetical protein niasHT_002671 [Heterodera trifolii]|uniref:Uncharacterized protein n=1 Tax=Heterodera trifolii TaxID=157864 RepID=A0ABD2MFT1_9BILA